MGTPDFAVMPLRTLVESGYNIVAVITAPDKPAGRGLKVQESAVKQYASGAGLTILQPEKLRAPEFLEELKTLKPDLGIVIAFRMLPEVVWALPKYGTFNLHASLLPQYRGAAPINWAIINGEKTTGVTTFLLNSEIDRGAILGQTEVPIGPEETAGELHDKLMETGTKLVLETVDRLAAGQAELIDQTQENGLLKGAPKLFKETCRIDWNADNDTVHNLIRGLSPYPTAWTELTGAGKEPINVKVFKARIAASTSASPGTIRTDGKTVLWVACADGAISIQELQLAGKKRMSIADFLRGFAEMEKYRFE